VSICSPPPPTTLSQGEGEVLRLCVLPGAWREASGAAVRRAVQRNATIPGQGLKPIIGFAASLFAVWCQVLLLATISLAPLGAGAQSVGNLPICRTYDGSQPAQRQPSHPAHNCVLCAVCVSSALPLGTLPPTPMLPDRQSVAGVRLKMRQPRAPPLQLVAAAQPRGPPSPI
jgi:hypothetical protein